jgi:nucleotide-binding universal stress UspA family protein
MNAAPLLARWGPYPVTRRFESVRPPRPKRLLVPLDGSRLAEGVIPFVLRIAEAFDLEVLLVRVVSATPPTILDGTLDVKMYDVPERLTEARRYLAEIAAKLRAHGIRVKTRARYGMPAAQIAAVAREAPADVIAMTTRGGDRAAWPVADSIAAVVLREAAVPVLMMGAARREAQAARSV